MADAVAKMQQPACHAGLDRVQRVAGRTELELRQHRADMRLERVPERGALVESGAKTEGGNLRCRPCHMHDGGNGRRRRPYRGQKADSSLAPNRGGRNRLSVRHVDHQGNGATMRKEDMLDRLTRARQNRALLERDRLKFARQ